MATKHLGSFNASVAALGGYSKGVSRVDEGGMIYTLNTDAVLQAARGNTDTVDQTALPSAGDGSDSADWVSNSRAEDAASEIIVNTVAELSALDIDTDGARVATRGHTISGVGAARYYYDASQSIAFSLKKMLVPHLSGVGSWVMILANDEAITPEHFGAMGDGVADDTRPMRDFARGVGNMSYPFLSNAFVARGIYSVTDTFLVNNKARFTLEIGSSEGTGSFVSGIVYNGPDGGGKEPENAKPAVRFHKCTEMNLPAIVVRNGDDVKPNSCGIMLSASDNFQRGDHAIGSLHAEGFGHDFIFGMSGRPVSTYTDTIGLNATTSIDLKASEVGVDVVVDDVIENMNVSHAITSIHCRETYISAGTTDGAQIPKIKRIIYNPAGTSPDMGVSQQALLVNKCGNVRVENLQVLQVDLGLAISYVDWDATTGTSIQAAAHGLAVGDVVHFPDSSSWTTPSPVTLNDWKYYEVIEVFANSFSVKNHRTNGLAVDFSGGAGMATVITVDGTEAATRLEAGASSFSISSLNCENVRGSILHKEGITSGRSANILGDLQSHRNVCSSNGSALVLESFASIKHAFLGGDLRCASVSALSLNFHVDPVTGENYSVKYLDGATTSQRPKRSVLGLNKLDSSGNMDMSVISSYLDEPMLNTPGDFEVKPSKVVDIPTSRTTATTLSGNAITLVDASSIAVGAPVIIVSDGGVLPNEIDTGRAYIVDSISGSDITLLDLLTDSTMTLTGSISGTVYVYGCVEMNSIGLRDTLSHSVELKGTAIFTERNGPVRSSHVKNECGIVFTCNSVFQTNWDYAATGIQYTSAETVNVTSSNQSVTSVSSWLIRRSPVNDRYIELVMVVGQSSNGGGLNAINTITADGNSANARLETLFSEYNNLDHLPRSYLRRT